MVWVVGSQLVLIDPGNSRWFSDCDAFKDLIWFQLCFIFHRVLFPPDDPVKDCFLCWCPSSSCCHILEPTVATTSQRIGPVWVKPTVSVRAVPDSRKLTWPVSLNEEQQQQLSLRLIQRVTQLTHPKNPKLLTRDGVSLFLWPEVASTLTLRSPTKATRVYPPSWVQSQ